MIIEEFLDKDKNPIKYKIYVPSEVKNVKSIFGLMHLMERKRISWNCNSIKEYISSIHKNDIKNSLYPSYNNGYIQWKVSNFSFFPYELQEYLQDFMKEYSSENGIMKIKITEEELFYLNLKYGKYILQDMSNKIIVEEYHE